MHASYNSSHLLPLLALLSLWLIGVFHGEQWMERLKRVKVKAQRYVPPYYVARRRRGGFASHFRHAIRADNVSEERILPLLLSQGRLFCRRRHREEILQSNIGWQGRAGKFIEMVHHGLSSMKRMNSTASLGRGNLPILLMLGDKNECNVTTKYDGLNFPRISWHEPAPKHGTDWCKVIPTPTYESWGHMNSGGRQKANFTWRSMFHSYSEKYPWASKIDRAVWRGSSTCSKKYHGAKLSETPRGNLVQKSMQNPELIDAGFVQFIQQYKSQADELANENQTILTERMSFDDQMKYKAILDIDGNSWSSRFPKLLCTNSVVIKLDPDYVEHFYSDLQPMIHYVPASLENVTDVTAYVLDKGNDDAMKAIVQSANQWCKKRMTKDALAKETLLQLEEYSRAVRNIVPKETRRLVDIAKDFEECS